jgi:hypothetical protein
MSSVAWQRGPKKVVDKFRKSLSWKTSSGKDKDKEQEPPRTPQRSSSTSTVPAGFGTPAKTEAAAEGVPRQSSRRFLISALTPHRKGKKGGN